VSKLKVTKRIGRCIGYRVAMAGDGEDWYLHDGGGMSTDPPDPVSRTVADAMLEDYAERDPDHAECFRVVRVMRYRRVQHG